MDENFRKNKRFMGFFFLVFIMKLGSFKFKLFCKLVKLFCMLNKLFFRLYVIIYYFKFKLLCKLVKL